MRAFLLALACLSVVSTADAAPIWNYYISFDGSVPYLPTDSLHFDAHLVVDPTSPEALDVLASSQQFESNVPEIIFALYQTQASASPLAGAFTLQPGDSLTWSFGAVIPLANVTIPNGLHCCVFPQINLTFADGTSRSFVPGGGFGWYTQAVDSATPVPEPASLLLLGSGIAGIAAKVRKRRNLPTA